MSLSINHKNPNNIRGMPHQVFTFRILSDLDFHHPEQVLEFSLLLCNFEDLWSKYLGADLIREVEPHTLEAKLLLGLDRVDSDMVELFCFLAGQPCFCVGLLCFMDQVGLFRKIEGEDNSV